MGAGDAMDLDLRGKRALITGSSRGLGFAMADQLCREGASVAICGRSAASASEAAAHLVTHGTRVWSGAADVGDERSYRSWMCDAVEQLGGCEIFIFNTSAGAVDASDDAWRRSCEVDLLGASRGVATLGPELVKNGGSILFITSAAATEQMIRPAAYNAVKAALLNFAKNLSAEYAPQGVTVNCLSPGPIQFPGGDWERVAANAPDFYRSMVARTDIGHLGQPEDVAQAAAFLVSPAAKFVTGVNFLVDGGMNKHVGG
jgi:3-oxoacyl-[acyl-carrier protein] reductase